MSDVLKNLPYSSLVTSVSKKPWGDDQPSRLNYSFRRPAKILLVDNDLMEARLVGEALKEIPLAHHIKFVFSGEEAIEYLSSQTVLGDLPDMIFLDLHLPRLTGHGVLKIIKETPKLCAIPVVVLSGSSDPQDVKRSYQNQANCYVQKPRDLDDLVMLMMRISEFWMSYALPIEKN